MTQEPGSRSAAETAADKVRTIVEAAERTAAELEAGAREEAARIRGQAERETEAQLRRVQALATGLSARAAELERALADAGERVRGAIEALRDELSELAGVAGDAGPAPSEPEPGARAESSSEVAGARGNAPVGATDASPESPSGAALDEHPPAGGRDVAGDVSSAVAQDGSAGDAPAGGADTSVTRSTAVSRDAAAAVSPLEGEAAADLGSAGGPAKPPPRAADPGAEGARVIALNMALNGSSREETARYLSENFELEDPEALLDDVFARAGG